MRLHTVSTVRALLANASVLSISCTLPASGRHTPSIFLSMFSLTPPSLSPLPLQTSKPHYPYLDLIPIPALRERLLIAHDLVDGMSLHVSFPKSTLSVRPFKMSGCSALISTFQFAGQEMWNDLSSDVRVWGTNPWEESAWEIDERFATKWWFLMGDEVLRGTNVWRGARGERALRLNEIKSRFGRRSTPTRLLA
jgi:hypothetical protein